MAASTKLGFVDALRGVAILLVILVHSSQQIGELSLWTKRIAGLGQFGVQLFFVASAYTLSRSWTHRTASSSRVSSFYIRRFFRIAPLYYLAILIYYFIGRMIGETDTYTTTNIAANLLFIHGFVPSANNGVVPGGWSIGTEMAFYLIFPVLVTLVIHLSAQSWRLLCALVVLIAGADILFAIWLRRRGFSIGNNSFVYFNLVIQLPVFLLGALAYFRLVGVTDKKLLIPTAGSVIFGVIAALLYWRGTDIAAIASISSAGFASMFFLDLLRCLSRVPKWIQRIGQVSYSMYVFHFIFAWYLVRAILPFVADLPGYLRLGLIYMLVVACTYVLARLTERSIERQGIALGEYLIRRTSPALVARTTD